MKTVRLFAVTLLAAAFATGCARSKEAYLKSGDDYLARAKYKEAIVQYRNAVNKDPRDGQARLKLAEAYLAGRDTAGAYRETMRAADLLPDNLDAQLRAGTLLLLTGQFEDAGKRAERVLALDASNVDGLILRANALGGLKDYDAALKNVREAIQLDPEKAGSYANLGAIELARGHQPEADSAFARAVQLGAASSHVWLAYANFQLASGRPAEAETALKKAVEIEPTNVSGRRTLASLYMALNRAPEAEPHLRTIADTGRPAERLALADYLAAMGRAPEALAMLQEEVSKNGKFTEAKLRIARIHAASKKYDEAHHITAGILAAEGARSDALALQSQVYLAESKLDEAARAATSAVAADANSIEAHYTAARVSLARRDFEAARNSLNEVLRLNPRAAVAQAQLSRIELLAGERAHAVELATAAAKTMPRDGAIRLSLVRTLIGAGNIQRAASELAPLLTAFPDDPSVLTHLGILRLAERRNEDARRAFESTIAKDPGNHDALRYLTMLDLSTNRAAEARRRLEPYLAAERVTGETLVLAADVEMRAGAPQKAEAHLRKAIEVAPYSINAYTRLGHLYVSQRRLDEGRREFEAAAARQPNAEGPATMVGIILGMQEKKADAKKQYESVIARHKDAPVAANNLAWMYAEDGENLDVALQLAQTAKQRMPGNADVNDTLGFIYLKKNLPSLAIPPLEEAVKAAPTSPRFLFRLATAQARVGNKAVAKELLQKALAIGRPFAEAGEAKTLLATL